MKKIAISLFVLFAAFVCQAVQVTKTPILFQGMDVVPLNSICSSDMEPGYSDEYRRCNRYIDDYAGYKIIKKSKEHWRDYLYAEYDLFN
jgi:hypothetical protein